MADDSADDFITEFWGTASKQYCYKKGSGKVEIKAKGIGKKTRNQVLTWEDYNDAIFNDGTEKKVEQVQIRSFGLKYHTIKLNKKIFTGDRKRILVDGDRINTLANGNWKDIGVGILPDNFSLPKKEGNIRQNVFGITERRVQKESLRRHFACFSRVSALVFRIKNWI